MAEKKKINYAHELTKGFLKENPVLRLVLGTCPTLATSTSVINGLGMGIAATIVLICSNVAISAMRKIIPEKARIPAYIVIIASFVTMVQMLVKAFVPALDQSLGVFLPLIVVNCIILGRAEAYASRNPVLASAVDGLGMGIGFTAALFLMGAVREILGAGTFLSGIDTMLGAYIDLGTFRGFDFTEELASIGLAPMTLFILPAGGFFVFGILMALANRLAERNGLKSATLEGCKGCPHAAFCNISAGEKCEEISEGEMEKTEENSEFGTRNSETIKEKPVISEKQSEAPDEIKTEKAESETVNEETVKAESDAVNEETAKAESEAAKEESAKPQMIDELKDEPAPISPPPPRKKNRKKKGKTKVMPDFSEPLPEVIPEFLKKEIESKKEENEE